VLAAITVGLLAGVACESTRYANPKQAKKHKMIFVDFIVAPAKFLEIPPAKIEVQINRGAGDRCER
jgi:hypothetical protein